MMSGKLVLLKMYCFRTLKQCYLVCYYLRSYLRKLHGVNSFKFTNCQKHLGNVMTHPVGLLDNARSMSTKCLLVPLIELDTMSTAQTFSTVIWIYRINH